MVLLGIVPVLIAVPPITSSFSMSAARLPNFAAGIAARWPPGPEPTTMRSYFSIGLPREYITVAIAESLLTRACSSAIILEICLLCSSGENDRLAGIHFGVREFGQHHVARVGADPPLGGCRTWQARNAGQTRRRRKNCRPHRRYPHHPRAHRPLQRSPANARPMESAALRYRAHHGRSAPRPARSACAAFAWRGNHSRRPALHHRRY